MMSSHQKIMESDSSDDRAYTFTEIIDADHLAINRLAGKARKLLASPTAHGRVSELRLLLLEITWRLVRHDFSEDVVMRPAFVSVLGEQGRHMVEEDSADHSGGRTALLEIQRELKALENERNEEQRREGLEEVKVMILSTFDQLAGHMKVESGDFLPYFESIVPTNMSQRLAREYADTLILTPGLTLPAATGHEHIEVAVFRGGADDYIHLARDRLKEVYASLVAERSNEKGQAWFDEGVQRELDKIETDKPRKNNKSGVSRENKQVKESNMKKPPTNPLGLPVSWDHTRKGKL